MEFAIETKNLVKYYGKKEVLNELDLSVPKGSVYGFLGRNGAGKTTTIQILMGLIPAQNGDFKVLGYDPVKQGVEMKFHVGYVADQTSYYENLSALNMMEYVASFYPNWNKSLAGDLIDQFHLDMSVKICEFSKGMKAKFSLILAMAHQPDLLILDEPTAGLDPGARRDFMETLLRSFQDEGKTVFISSHLVNEIEGVVDHVGMLHQGKLLLEKELSDLKQQVRSHRLIFSGDQKPLLDASEIIANRWQGRELILTTQFDNKENEAAYLKSFQAESIRKEIMSLEDLFVALLPVS